MAYQTINPVNNKELAQIAEFYAAGAERFLARCRERLPGQG